MLPAYKDILVATDLTPNSTLAFKHAVMLSRPTQAKIHLLHVVPEIDAGFRSYVSTVMGNGNLEKFDKQHEEEAHQTIKSRLEAFAEGELADHPEDLDRVTTVDVLHGNPVARILQMADQLNVDVIVMGSHGKGAIEYSFLGSTAEKVLRKTRRPVFIIPIQ